MLKNKYRMIIVTLTLIIITGFFYFQWVLKPRLYERTFKNAIQVSNMEIHEIDISYTEKNHTIYSVHHEKADSLDTAMKKGYSAISVAGTRESAMNCENIDELCKKVFKTKNVKKTCQDGLTTISDDYLQMAIRYSPYYEKTLIYFGMPTIYMDF